MNPLEETRSANHKNPRELADDTLQSLLQFSETLEELSILCSNCVGQPDFYRHFTRLIEGIGTFTDGIVGVKRILNLGLFNGIQLLEMNLLTILKDILTAQEESQLDHMTQLLREPLSNNLREWRENGLPALIRSRDC